MRNLRTLPYSLAFAAALCALPFSLLAAQSPQDDMTGPANYDEVAQYLALNLNKDKETAQDAARKLAGLGKRAISVLREVLNSNLDNPKGNEAAAYYAVWALSRIRNADAARMLIPILENQKTKPELRQIAVEAVGLEFLEEGGDALRKIAAADPDVAMRKKAYAQLMMPNYWAKSEKLFVDALADPDDEIRSQAARVCFFAKVFQSATGKLIELAEKDPSQPVRMNAMLALQQMRIKKAVPMLVRVAGQSTIMTPMQQQALRAVGSITGVSMKDVRVMQAWWEKFGAEYAKLEEKPPQLGDIIPADPEPTPDNPQPKPPDVEPESAPGSGAAGVPQSPVEGKLPAFPDEIESTGSRRRRLRLLESKKTEGKKE